MLSIKNKIKDAIRKRRTIAFDYSKDGSRAARAGNPHVLTEDAATGELCLHMVQTGGDASADLPRWRMFYLNQIGTVIVDETAEPFNPADDYNPDSGMYATAIEKIEI